MIDRRKRFLAALQRQQQLDNGGLSSVRAVRRRAVGLSKHDFDSTALELQRERAITLHHHDLPSSLSPQERKQMVHDGRTYYVGVALRHAGPAPLRFTRAKPKPARPAKAKPPKLKAKRKRYAPGTVKRCKTIFESMGINIVLPAGWSAR